MSLFGKSGQVLQILQDAKGLITPEANFASWQAIDSLQPVDSSGRHVNSDEPVAYQPLREWMQPYAVDSSGQSVNTDSPAACQWSFWGAVELASLRLWDKDERSDLAYRARMFFDRATPVLRARARGPLREGEHDEMMRYVQSATYHRDVLQGLDLAIASCKSFRRWYSWGCDTWQYPSVYPR